MQTIIPGAILTVAVAGGFLAKGISSAWIRFCVLGAFALLPILSTGIALLLEECDDRLPNGMCNGAGITIVGVMAIMPFWILAMATGWWLKHRQRRV